MDPHQQSLAIAASRSLVTDSHIMYAALQRQPVNKAKQAVVHGDIVFTTQLNSQWFTMARNLIRQTLPQWPATRCSRNI